MADIKIRVPDGDYCSDRNHLDCLYAKHENGFHMCLLFEEFLDDNLRTLKIGPETVRARRKCLRCRIVTSNDLGKGYSERYEVRSDNDKEDYRSTVQYTYE